MYVEYMIPAKKTRMWPVVMIHGSNHTGKTFGTTPDGREGWATYFARHDIPVYVVDHAGRGRSGFDPTPFNQARVDSSPALIPNLARGTIEAQFTNFRFGATAGVWWPDSRFPQAYAEQYYAQLLGNSEATISGGGTNTVNALVKLLDKIGPAIVMVHSQSGSYGLDVLRQRPNLVKGFIDVEGNCAPVTQQEIDGIFSKIPMIAPWGDHSEGAVGANGDARRNGCISTINAINAAGGNATFLLLPALGIHGNTHMMMMDNNNLQIADMLLNWIEDNVEGPGPGKFKAKEGKK
jgi:pimeloyl-ACP methyl ester carboxylesterase